MKNYLSDINLFALLIDKDVLFTLFDMTVLTNLESLHEGPKSCDRKVINFRLADIVVGDSFLTIRIFIKEALFADLFDGFSFFVDFNYLGVGLLLKWFLLIDSSDIGYLFSINLFIYLPLFLKFIHNLQHIVLQTQSCIFTALEVSFHNCAISIDVYPANVASI